ncbi:MAG: PD40 domain-containing protein, partial [Bdellovibrionales bacterium]|nr:PD40 domain-containing protein [Bdellovibrionales bacterium]
MRKRLLCLILIGSILFISTSCKLNDNKLRGSIDGGRSSPPNPETSIEIPNMSFSKSEIWYDEGRLVYNFTIEFEEPTAHAFTLPIIVQGSYSSQVQSNLNVSIPQGVSSHIVELQVSDDSVADGLNELNISLNPPVSGKVKGIDQLKIYIVDNDGEKMPSNPIGYRTQVPSYIIVSPDKSLSIKYNGEQEFLTPIDSGTVILNPKNLLPSSPSPYYYRGFSDDSQWQIYSQTGVDAGIYMIKTDGSEVKTLLDKVNKLSGCINIYNLKFNFNTNIFAFNCNSSGGIYIGNINSGDFVNLTNPTLFGQISSFEISPNGQHIALIAKDTTSSRQELYLGNTDGTGMAKVNANITSGQEVKNFIFSPNSNYLAYVSDEDDTSYGNLYIIDSNHNNKKRLNNILPKAGYFVSNLKFTPDSNYVVSQKAEDDNIIKIHSNHVSGVGEYLISRNTQNVFDFEISPLSSHVAFTEYSGMNSQDYLVINAITGGSLTNLSARPSSVSYQDGVRDYEFTSNGSKVVYISEDETAGRFDLYSVDIDGSNNNKLSQATMPNNRQVESFKITPNNNYVVFTTDFNTEGKFELFKRPIDGSGTVDKLSPTI